MLAGDLDQVLGLITCEWGLSSRSAKPATAAGIDAGENGAPAGPEGGDKT